MTLSRRLDRQLRVFAPADVDDGKGGQARTWVWQADVHAELVPLAGREFIAGGGVASNVAYRATLRYHAGITPQWRVTVGSDTFEIVAVREVGRRAAVELDLVEVR